MYINIDDCGAQQTTDAPCLYNVPPSVFCLQYFDMCYISLVSFLSSSISAKPCEISYMETTDGLFTMKTSCSLREENKISIMQSANVLSLVKMTTLLKVEKPKAVFIFFYSTIIHKLSSISDWLKHKHMHQAVLFLFATN